MTIAALIFGPPEAAGSYALRYRLVARESAYLAQRECEQDEGFCKGWDSACTRIALRRINCELGWHFPWLFEPEKELRCSEVLFWGLGRRGFLALRGQSGLGCEPEPSLTPPEGRRIFTPTNGGRAVGAADPLAVGDEPNDKSEAIAVAGFSPTHPLGQQQRPGG